MNVFLHETFSLVYVYNEAITTLHLPRPYL